MLMCMWQIGKSNILYNTLRTKHSIITCSSALISQWGFFLNRPHREFEPCQNINLKLWCCKLTRSKVEVLKEYKPPLKQLIPQKSWNCPPSHSDKISFLIILGIISLSELSTKPNLLLLVIYPHPKLFSSTLVYNFSSYPADRQTYKGKNITHLAR